MPEETPQSLGSVFDEAYAEVSGQPQNTPPEQTTEQTPETPQRSTLDYLSNRGIDVSEFQSDDEWFEAAEQFEANRRARESEIADWQRNRDQYLAWQQEQQKPPEQPAEPEPDQPTWQPPVVSETAKHLYSSGMMEADAQSGMLKAKDPYMQRYADEFNNFVQWKQEKANLIFTNPEKFYEETGLLRRLEGLKPEFDEEALLTKAEERMLQKLQAAQQSQAVRSEFEQKFPLLYQVDQSGCPVVNAEGNWVPTDVGKSFEEALSVVEAEGVQDKNSRVRLAMRMVAPQLEAATGQSEQQQPEQQAPQAAPPTKQEVREQKKDTWLKQNTNGRNRLSPEDARIAETVRKTDPGDEKYKTLSDVWDESYQQTVNELR